MLVAGGGMKKEGAWLSIEGAPWAGADRPTLTMSTGAARDAAADWDLLRGRVCMERTFCMGACTSMIK
jgi:hypothetical protein